MEGTSSQQGTETGRGQPYKVEVIPLGEHESGPLPNQSPYPETARIAEILLRRPEVAAPEYINPEGVRAAVLEGQYWVGTAVLSGLGILHPVTWGSIYADAVVAPFSGTAPFRSINVLAAQNLFGAKGAAAILPAAVCPILDVPLIQEQMEILQTMHATGETDNLPPHLLSVSGLARALGTNVISSFVEEQMVLHVVRKFGNTSRESQRQAEEVLRGMKEAADGDLFSVEILEDDPTLHAVITISDKRLWLKNGVAYEVAKRSGEDFKPPASTLHLTFSIDGHQLVLQMGFEEQMDTFAALEKHLQQLEGASVILEMAFRRAYLGEDLLSEMVNQLLRELIRGDHHDIQNRAQKIELILGNLETILADMIVPILEKIAAGVKVLPEAAARALEFLNQLRAKIPAGRSGVKQIEDLADHLLDLAESTATLTKLRAIQFIPQIERMVTITSTSLLGLFDLTEEEKDRLDIALVTDVTTGARAVEFAGGLTVIVRNLTINAAEVAAERGIFDGIDFTEDQETKLAIRIIITEETYRQREYYRIAVLDNGTETLSEERIAELLDIEKEETESTTGGSGRALKILHRLAIEQAPLAPQERVFTIENGLPGYVASKLNTEQIRQLEGINGVCVSFLVQKASPASP